MPEDNSNRSSYVESISRLLVLILLALSALALFAHKIIDTDIWWHLRTGRFIIETGSIPAADMYSYTAGGNRWIDLHWLFQVIVYEVFGALGSYGLSLLFIGVFSAALVILWNACPKGKSFFAQAFLFGLALVICSPRFLARPEAFTFLVISIYMLVLLTFERVQRRWIVFLLIPLQIVWTNMQGLFVLGPFLVAAYLSQSIYRIIVARVSRRETPLEVATEVKTLLVVFLLSIAACLINPYGFEGLLFPFTLFTRVGGMENVFARSIGEFQPPFSGYNLTSPLKFFGFYFALCAGLFALDYKNIKLSRIIIFVATGYLAFNARRNVPIFTLAVLPLAVDHMGNLIGNLKDKWEGSRSKFNARITLAGRVFLGIICLMQIHGVLTNQFYMKDKRAERFGFGFKELTFPHGAFRFIKEQGIRGPLFNNLDIGGIFIWEMYPDEKVFIDARLEVNSAEALSEYRLGTRSQDAFSQLSDKYDVNAAVISHNSLDGLDMIPIVYGLPDWSLVYLGPVAAVFVRETPDNQMIIAEKRIDVAKDSFEPSMVPDLSNDSSPWILRSLLGNTVALFPDDTQAQARFNLGLVFLVLGQNERAVTEFRAGLKLFQQSPEGHYNLGIALDGIGNKEQAIRQYQKTIKLNPRHTRAHVNLGKIYDELGALEKAEAEYKLAIELGEDDPVPLYNLGMLHYRRGEKEKARERLRQALEIDPSFSPAREALNELDQDR